MINLIRYLPHDVSYESNYFCHLKLIVLGKLVLCRLIFSTLESSILSYTYQKPCCNTLYTLVQFRCSSFSCLYFVFISITLLCSNPIAFLSYFFIYFPVFALYPILCVAFYVTVCDVSGFMVVLNIFRLNFALVFPSKLAFCYITNCISKLLSRTWLHCSNITLTINISHVY